MTFHASSSSTISSTVPNLQQLQSFAYDVFVSFRGSDTRQGITKALVARLKDEDVEAFLDETDLEKGEKIEELLNVIRRSHMFILIISEHYGDSRWCIREMMEIVGSGRKFLPVFYKVDPNDVKHQTGRFGEAFRNSDAAERCGKTRDEVIEAFKDVASRSGYVLDGNTDDRNQEEVIIRQILEQVHKIVEKAPFIISKYIVGADERISKIKELFKHDCPGAQMIGICGMGGMGKTTLALGVFNDIFHDFTTSTFIENVREGMEKHGLCFMQQKILHGLIKNDTTQIDGVERGKGILKGRLSKRKVLIVLDDIDKTEQLDALVGGCDWFGSGSKVLLTTRNKGILEQHEVVEIFGMDDLKEDESLNLLSHHAFGIAQPPREFAMLCKEVSKLAHGLPLAIQVYGCHLKHKNKKEWEHFLRVVTGMPSQDLYERLEISLEGLHEKERSMFLDIACLLIGCHQEIVIEMWKDGSGLDGLLTLNKLVEKALVRIDKDNILRMHDIIRDMARNIIRKDSNQYQSAPTRIWDYDVVQKALIQKQGLERVEGIVNLEVERVFPKQKSPQVDLDSLHNLRILQIDGAGSAKKLPERIELLDWKWCSISHIPSSWDLSNIVVLNLSNSQLKVWSPKMMSKRLRLLDLSHCTKLKSVGNFNNTPNLVKLVLEGCLNLTKMDESLGVLKQLLFLNMLRCSNVEALPKSIVGLSNLELLNLSHTSSLQYIPESIGDMTNLRHLYLYGSAVERLPPSLASLERLQELHICSNQRLREFPENILGSQLSNLRKLKLECSQFEVLPNDLCRLSSLELLNLGLITKLKSVPERLGDLRCLRELILKSTSIETLPDSISLLQNLQTLDLSFCRELKELPNSVGQLIRLTTLSLSYTDNLLELPNSVGDLSNLTQLDLNESGIESLPTSIGCLHKLEELDLGRCVKLKELPCLRELKDLRKLSLYGSGINSKGIEEWKLPIQIVEAIRSRERKESNVFISMCPHMISNINGSVWSWFPWTSSNDTKVVLSSTSRLREKLRLQKEIGSVMASDDEGEWLSKLNSISWRTDYINSCNVLVLVCSKEYLESEDCLAELQVMVESIRNNDRQQIVIVFDNIDQSTIYDMSARDSRWRTAVDVVFDKSDTHKDSRGFSTAETLEDSIVDEVMYKLEKMMGTPFSTILITSD